MTIPASTVPAAVTAIIQAIQAQLSAANEGGVQLVVGTPGPPLPNTLIGVCTAVRRQVKRFAMVGSGGPNYLEESYTIDVSISVAEPVPEPSPRFPARSDSGPELWRGVHSLCTAETMRITARR